MKSLTQKMWSIVHRAAVAVQKTAWKRGTLWELETELEPEGVIYEFSYSMESPPTTTVCYPTGWVWTDQMEWSTPTWTGSVASWEISDESEE